MKKPIVFTFLMAALALFMNSAMPRKYHFLVGTYTKNSKESLHYATFDPNQKTIAFISHSEFIEDPSFLTLNQKNNRVYTISEENKGHALAFDFNKSKGTFTPINKLSSGGEHPCHISLDKSEKWLAVSNYTGGSFSVLGLKSDGSIDKSVAFFQHVGSGPNTERQEKPHVHSAIFSPENTNILVADLGTDKVYNYAFNDKTGKTTLKQELPLSPGSGPRHMVFHSNLPYLYVVQEMTGKISKFSWVKNKLKFQEEISSLPANFTGKNSSADIHISPDGKFLYASNRFYETIVTCAINPKNGKLTQLEQTSVKGLMPRNFNITPDGKYLLVANQLSDNIVVFRLEKGRLVDINVEGKVSMPVCIKFLN
jgi:6-phosphogluconolactonase